MEGISLVPGFRGGPLKRTEPLFWEHEGNRPIREGRWKLVAKENQPWELYDMEKDRVRAYLAAVSSADAQVGRLLGALDKSPYRDNTVIVFVGDNGWHLGPKEHWGKTALWNEATRVPLIWVAPGVSKGGATCEQGVGLMSLYLTLCELAVVPVPKHAEGVSIRPLLADPATAWSQPALTTMYKGNHTLRTAEWRYIRYEDGTEELYNERTDPHEWTNLAAKPEYADVKTKLAKYLPVTNAAPVEAKAAPAKKKKRGKRAQTAK